MISDDKIAGAQLSSAFPGAEQAYSDFCAHCAIFGVHELPEHYKDLFMAGYARGCNDGLRLSEEMDEEEGMRQ